MAVALEYQTIPGNPASALPLGSRSRPSFPLQFRRRPPPVSFVRVLAVEEGPLPPSFRARYEGGEGDGCGVSVARFKGSLRMGSRARAVYNG